VVFVISDDHGGITKAVDKHFQGATEKNEVWQEKKYLDMEAFKDWAAARPPAGQSNHEEEGYNIKTGREKR